MHSTKLKETSMCKHRDEKRKTQNLENIIQALSAPLKRNVCRNLSNEVSDFDKI